MRLIFGGPPYPLPFRLLFPPLCPARPAVLRPLDFVAVSTASLMVPPVFSMAVTIPSNTVLGAGETITLHTGNGTSTNSDLYWGSGSAIWNNGGDTITVTNDQGKPVIEEDY